MNTNSKQTTIDLLLPGLFDRASEWVAAYGEICRHPLLDKTLVRANHSQIGVSGFEYTLWYLFDAEINPNEELPAAAILGKQSEIKTTCLADPVSFKADIADIYFSGRMQLTLTSLEQLALAELINTHLAELDGQFAFDSHGNGLLSLSTSQAPSTTPPTTAMGKSITPFLPQGEHKTFWHGLMNEFQMLLHGSQINFEREVGGQMPVNALWCWGTGQLQRTPQSNYDNIYANDPFAAAFTEAVHGRCQKLPQEIKQLLQAAHSQHQLFIYDGLLDAAKLDDYTAWETALDQLTSRWLTPLWMALRAGRLNRLRIFSCDGQVFDLTPANSRYFWRRSRQNVFLHFSQSNPKYS